MARPLDIDKIHQNQRDFVQEREWDKFHSPKNLTMALSGEAGELCEIFQWMTEEESRQIDAAHPKREDLCDELADIQYYLLRIADILKIDLSDALESKMAKNAKKYPVSLSRGNAKKYTEF